MELPTLFPLTQSSTSRSVLPPAPPGRFFVLVATRANHLCSPSSQINEAVTLIARSRPENVRVSYISQFTAAAKLAAPTSSAEAAGEEEEEDKEEEEDEKKEVPEETEEMREAKRKVVKDLVASVRSLAVVGNDREFEGFSNLVLSLVLSLFAPSHPDFSTLLLSFTDTLTFNADRTANPSLSARYAAVATLFNALPNPSSDPSAPSSLRLTVLLKLISCAASNEDFPVIRPALERLESWLSLWGFGLGTPGEEEGNAAISTIVAALSSRSKKAEARSILLAHLSTPSAVSGQAITPSSSAAALVSQLIVLSLALPDVFDFSTLSSLAAPSVPALAQLLAIFQSGDVEAFEKFAVDNAQVLAEQKLEKDQLERKLRLLALAELCSKKVGELVSYAEIAQALRLSKAESDDGEEVETWVIDGTSPHSSLSPPSSH